MKDKENLPRVLCVGISSWRKDATAHTLENIFSCWNPEKLALVYTRSGYPDSTVASRYFQISEQSVLASIIRPWNHVGLEVYNSCEVSEASKREKKMYAKAHKRHSYFKTLCREIVWILGHWRTFALKSFVKDFNPDIIFCPIYPTIYMGLIQRFIIRISKKPFVCYLADDNYSYESCSGVLSYIHRFFLRRQVKFLATQCAQMYVIVDKEKEETDSLFGTNSIILTKGVDFSDKPLVDKDTNAPISLVYTGSLIIGRGETIAMLAEEINLLNSNGLKVTLDVYSQDIPNDMLYHRINSGASRYRGHISREEVQKVQQQADVVIFAEALTGKESNIARLSFSTKLTDYLSNGKCILAIGKRNIAPIDYLIKNNAAIVASSRSDIKQALERLVENPSLVKEFARNAYDCAVRNHEKIMMDNRFINSMRNL